MTDYTLDIDETGRFTTDEPWSAVVGWLRPGLPGSDDDSLRSRFDSLFPAQWPLHAADANARGAGDSLRRATRAVVDGRGLLLFARMAVAPREDVGSVVAHPYVYALRALLARAALAHPQDARIHIRTADRTLLIRVGARTAVAYVHAVFVNDIARSAVRDLPTAALLLPVHMRFRMNAQTPAGLIVADVFANRVGHVLRRDANASLSDVSQSLSEDFGARVAVPGRVRDLPTFAADGRWEDAIRESVPPRGPVRVDGGGWADEQARRWIEEVAR